MKTIPLAEITLGPRQRKLFDRARVVNLADSIAEKGLFHPVVCREEVDKIILVAGERRLRAIQHLSNLNLLYFHDGIAVPPGTIPYILINSDLDAIQVREAELEENIIREDLTWQEKTAALDELHELRLAQNPKQTNRTTAKEIAAASPSGERGSSIKQAEREISQARLVASYLDNPEVANATSLTQAHSIVSRQMEAELSMELTRRGKVYKSAHTLIHGDFNKKSTIEQLPKDFTCIIADPPYGVGANSFGDNAQHAHTYDDSFEVAEQLAISIFDIGYQLTVENAHLFLFCDIDLFASLKELASDVGWKVWRTPLIWNKTSSSSHAPSHNKGFRRCYELILFAVKGSKPFAQVYRDVIDASTARTKDVAAQKPTELYSTILGRSCFPGDKVLDPCCGSGTIFKAAEELNLEAWGVEKNKEAHAIANLNLSELGETDD